LLKERRGWISWHWRGERGKRRKKKTHEGNDFVTPFFVYNPLKHLKIVYFV
jgi:hypothetical protein